MSIARRLGIAFVAAGACAFWAALRGNSLRWFYLGLLLLVAGALAYLWGVQPARWRKARDDKGVGNWSSLWGNFWD